MNVHIRVRNLVRKYCTRNPYFLAKELGIEIEEKYLSDDMPKGLFKKILRKKFVVLNLTRINSDSEKEFVLAHELGHAILHSSDEAFFLHDHTFYQRGKFEIEANKFAAELLIDENYIDKCALFEMSLEQIACYYGVPKELVKVKFKL
jgi:Zn-dependent peptidase ImmA (M78 family)